MAKSKYIKTLREQRVDQLIKLTQLKYKNLSLEEIIKKFEKSPIGFSDDEEKKLFIEEYQKMTDKFEIEFEVKLKEKDVDTEDGGQAKIIDIVNDSNDENGIFIRLHSWDENREHLDFNKLIGRKVKIKIETLD